MQFVSVRELRNRSAAIWKTLSEKKDLVATSNGKPIALLSATSDETLEESLGAIRRARAQSAVAATQQALFRAGTDRLCMEEINAEVRAARRERGK
ncbi:MAG: type II toxin-antitoxin system Phd/YefM family antitoxin [Gammaproteobacteria bacterium]|nr:type II toxin-antitoxin system Phd/YefM family antitoxin [Gammaproteobacteria bacterium]